MSFKANDITISNYEEYFLLYVDGELSPAEMQGVEAFVLTQPHLQMELDLLMQTRLEPDSMPFSGKELLMADHMKAESLQEELLLYIDGELPDQARAAFEQTIASSKQLSAQIDLFKRTKLDSSDHISYPDKKELYKHNTFTLKLWLPRVAAVLILALATTLYLLPSNQDEISAPVATIARPADEPSMRIEKHKPLETFTEDDEYADAGSGAKRDEFSTNVESATFAVSHAHRSAPVRTESLGTTTTQPNQPQAEYALSIKPIAFQSTGMEVELQKLTAGDVTSAVVTAYHTQEPVFASAMEEGIKGGGSLKGFLRKATRFIERKTGVGTTTDDDRLLIGALEVNLE